MSNTRNLNIGPMSTPPLKTKSDENYKQEMLKSLRASVRAEVNRLFLHNLKSGGPLAGKRRR